MNWGSTTTGTTSSTSTTYSFAASNAFYVRIMAPPRRDPPLPQALVDRVWECASLLDLDLPCHRDDVDKARKRLAKIHHPDAGGSLEMMQQINAAADFLKGQK